MERAKFAPRDECMFSQAGVLLPGRGKQPAAASVLPGGRGFVGGVDHWVEGSAGADGGDGVRGAEQLLGAKIGAGQLFSGEFRLVDGLLLARFGTN